MSKIKNREVIFIDEEGKQCTTYFRGTDFYSIIEYFKKFEDSMVDIVQINNPDYFEDQGEED